MRRDLTLAYRHRGEIANPLVFFLIVITMVPLSITPEPAVLATLAPGLIWVVALLSTLLSLDSLFRSDFDDGSLEQLLISPQPLYLMVFAKVLAHWLVTGLPLTLMAPLLGVLLSLPEAGYWPLCLSLLLGTGSLSLIGAVGAALTVALRKGGLLLSLIIMPLYTPVLIFGAGAVRNAIDGFLVGPQLAILGAMLALAIIMGPLAAAGALRIGVNG
ncbi:heme exporter protein CcmB [Exilibacterium tricleocarpae]|uniref:Heme exporter protein B n=1 Tax=Exilibacterium tricleocarpae TaxID=2591008 RepID=A0A545TM19_9GAMM|nr:heme exporter protein CcmB [Exilibacterium tricleocarpae]